MDPGPGREIGARAMTRVVVRTWSWLQSLRRPPVSARSSPSMAPRRPRSGLLLAGLVAGQLAAQSTGPAGYRLRDTGQRLGEGSGLGMGVAVGDVDHDGDLDAVTTGIGLPTRVWLNDGNGRFMADSQVLGSNVVAMAIDVRTKESVRVVTAEDAWESSLRTWRRLDSGFVREDGREIGGDVPAAVAWGDLGGTYDADIVLTRNAGRPVEIWMTPGAGTSGATPLTLGDKSALEAALGDVDQDGDWDVLLAGEDLSVWLNPGRALGEASGIAGPFTPAGPAFGGGGGGFFLGVALGDLDGDGDLDAFTAESESHDRVWINQGGTPVRFADSGQRLGPGIRQSRDVALGDLDRDGDLDAVVARRQGNLVYWNDGAGGFTAQPLVFGNGDHEALALGDFNRDGNLDVFVIQSNGVAEVWLGELSTTPPGRPRYSFRGDWDPVFERFDAPEDLAVDEAGVLYVVEAGGQRVRRIGVEGTISTLVSHAGGPSSGDGGPLSEARFGRIASVAADARGNVYLGEDNFRIRRIAPDGTVSTVAGTGVRGYRGDGGPAEAAELGKPSVVRLDPAGNLFLVDETHRVIRRVGTNGVITTVAGNGGTGLSGDGGPAVAASIDRPNDLLVGADGSLFLAHRQGSIRRIKPNGIISTLPATAVSELNFSPLPLASVDPVSLALDREQRLVVGETGRVRQLDPQGRLITLLSPGNSEFRVEAMVRMPDGDLVLAVDHRLIRLAFGGEANPVAGKLRSSPPAGEKIDFGAMDIVDDQLRNWEAEHVNLSLDWDGTIQAYRILSIELLGDDKDLFRCRVSGPCCPAEPARDTTIQVECLLERTRERTAEATLRITVDHPTTPVWEYPLRAAVTRDRSYSTGDEESLLFMLFQRLGGGSRPAARQGGPAEAQEILLTLDPRESQRVTTRIPPHLGGGSVVISRFEGEVRVGVGPDPQEAGFLELTVLGGQFRAPSFSLPGGIQTGPTTLTFGDPALSSGRLNPATGEYSAKASATIVNSLFPEGISVDGSYRGTYDTRTGRASLRSFSVDRIPRTKGLQVIRNGDGAVVVWTSQNPLEAAPSLDGPWQVQTNAVSPHRLNLGEDGPRFYRLGGAAPR